MNKVIFLSRISTFLAEADEPWIQWFNTSFVDGTPMERIPTTVSFINVNRKRGFVVQIIPRNFKWNFNAEIRVFGEGDPESIPFLEISCKSTNKCWEQCLPLMKAWVIRRDEEGTKHILAAKS